MECAQPAISYDEKDLNDFFKELDIDINFINLADIERIERNDKNRPKYKKIICGYHYIYIRII